MKNLFFLLFLVSAVMTTACSTTGTEQDSATDATSTAPAEATESQASTETAAEETPAATTEAPESQAPATTDSSSDGSDLTWVCTHDGSTRTIKVVYHDEGPKVCEVIYEKSSGTQNLWNVNNDKTYCEDKAIEFVTKQEGWGWSCNQQ